MVVRGPSQDVDLLISAMLVSCHPRFGHTATQLPDASLLVVGGRDQMTSCRDLVRALALERYTSRVPDMLVCCFWMFLVLLPLLWYLNHFKTI